MALPLAKQFFYFGNAGATSKPAEPEHVITNDGVRLVYEKFGCAGPVIVYIHGWSGSRHYFDLNVRVRRLT